MDQGMFESRKKAESTTLGELLERYLRERTPKKKGGIAERKVARLDGYRWEKRCRGLYQLPAAA
jgi:hypothetical protein